MYRDDRDALRAQIDKLQAELEEVKKHGDPALEERARALLDDVERMEKRLVAMRAEARRIEGGGAGKGRALLVAGAIALPIALLAGGGALVWLRSAAPVPAPIEAPVVVAPIAPVPAVPAPPAVAAPPTVGDPAPAPDGVASLTWKAAVVRATGVALAPGARCTVKANVVRARARHAFSDKGLHIACGEVNVYDTDMPTGGGVNAESSHVRELPSPGTDLAVYTLRRTDSGARPGPRSELDLDTVAGKAVIWKSGLGAMRLELTLEPTSVPAEPLSLSGERIQRTGKVVTADPGAPTKPGDPCVAQAVFTGEEHECAAAITCGGKLLALPADGAICDHRGGVLGAASAATGAARSFHFEREAREATVGAATPRRWAASIELE